MNGFIAIDNQIELIETIIGSLNKVVLAFLEIDVRLINQTIYDTIALILKFVDKVITLLPELLLGDNEYIKIRKRAAEQFDRVVIAWSEIFISPEIFVKEWNIFLYEWSILKEKLIILSKSKSIVFLSLN